MKLDRKWLCPASSFGRAEPPRGRTGVRGWDGGSWELESTISGNLDDLGGKDLGWEGRSGKGPHSPRAGFKGLP